MLKQSLTQRKSPSRTASTALQAAALSLLALCLRPASAAHPAPTEADPETVLATFHVKDGQLPAFLAMMADYQKLLQTRSLIVGPPPVLLQGVEDGKPVVLELFTWKSGDIPDDAPPEVRSYWDKMNAMVEKRAGHDGIEFIQLAYVPAPAATK